MMIQGTIPAMQPKMNGHQFTLVRSVLTCSITSPNRIIEALTPKMAIMA